MTGRPYTFVTLTARVPTTDASAIYRAAQVLDIHATVISDGLDIVYPVVDDDGLHVVAYPSDVSGNGRTNFTDPSLIARLATSLDSTLASFPTYDFGLIADVSLNNRVNLTDASLVAQFAASLPVPLIPPIPPGVVNTTNAKRVTLAADRGAAFAPRLTPSRGTAAKGEPGKPAGRASTLDPADAATPMHYPAAGEARPTDLPGLVLQEIEDEHLSLALEDAIDELLESLP